LVTVSSAPAIYELTELSALSGVTARTVRYYIQQGLVPSPSHPGPGAKYGDGHLGRLRLIRQLQRQHLPLSEIRRRLAGLDDQQVAVLAAGASPRESAPSSRSRATAALDYVRGVLGEAAPRGLPTPVPASPPRLAPDRSQWERLTVADDVEIHIRRPLSRDQNRRVERLLHEARRIFAEEP
jgi:DNA-binding transcriptional MerR regulator